MSPQTKSRKSYWLIIVVLILFALFFGGIDKLPDLTTALNGNSTTEQPANLTEVPGNPNGNIAVYFTNPVELYVQGITTGGIENNLISLIDNAKTSIDTAFYQFDLESVAQALIAAHNRGVTVRIVYDDEFADPDPQIGELTAAGIPATPDKRTAFMHNKFFVFDHATVWTGSFNITFNAAYKNNENAIVIMSEKLADNYTAEFSEMFSGKFGPKNPSDTPYPTLYAGNTLIENYFAPEDNVMMHVIAAVNSAKSSIKFLTFTFTADDLADAMIDRMHDGVTVIGVFETQGSGSQYSECSTLLGSGASIYLDGNSYTLHDKVIIIDESIVITGSFNFTASANESNDENLLIIYDPAIASLYNLEFNQIADIAHPQTGTTCNP